MAVLLGLLSIDPDRIKTMADAERLVGSKPREIHFSGNAEHYPEPLLSFLLARVVRPMIAEGATFERFMYNPRLPFPIELIETPGGALSAVPPSSPPSQMSSLTVPRALEIYDHLVRAMLGKHNYGGDEAEIYVYLALVQNPGVDRYVQCGAAARGEPGMFKADFEETYTAAFQDFRRVFLEFEKHSNCRVLYRSDSSQPWMPAREISGIVSTHRFYAKVVRPGEK